MIAEITKAKVAATSFAALAILALCAPTFSGDVGFGDTRPVFSRVTVGTVGKTSLSMSEPTSRSSHGTRIYCPISHFSYDDPIVNPGQPQAAHLHMFWGNTAADAFTNGADIRDSGSATCEGGTNNLSSAWTPALFNDSGEVVLPEQAFIYYKANGIPNDRYDLLQEVPHGIEMLASSETLHFNQWVNLGHYTKVTANENSLVLTAQFPTCVATDDGTMTGNPILRYQDMEGDAQYVVNSHVSYSAPHWLRNEVGCPDSHPYGFPSVSYTVKYDRDMVGDNPYLASDTMMGAEPLGSMHADYIAGLAPEVSAEILACAQESRSCGFEGGVGQLPERFYAPNGIQIYRYSVSLEPETDRTPFGAQFRPMAPNRSINQCACSHNH
jgi:hypothetical protein